jgi:signal transduction histidine kinase
MTTAENALATVGRVDRLRDDARAYWPEGLAVLLASAGVVEGLTANDTEGRGPSWLLPFVVVLMAMPLLFQRWFPFAAPAATVLIGIVIAISSDGHTVSDSLVAFMLLFLVAWLFGRLERRLAVTGLVLLYVAVLVVDHEANDLSVGDIVFPAVFLTMFWGASFVLHARAAEVRHAEERAARLLEEQEEAAARAVEDERQRIARELHDVIAHSVSQMTVQAGAVRRLLLPEQERERETLQSVEATGREALTEMRRLVGLLRERDEEAELAPQPSLSRLDTLLGSMRERGLEVDLEVEGKARELSPGVDLSAYRLVQEALTSSIRAGSPGHAWVAVRWRDRELELEVGNDGLPDPAANGFARGLPGMRERVALVGGTLETGRRDGGGFVVRCHLPLESAA